MITQSTQERTLSWQHSLKYLQKETQLPKSGKLVAQKIILEGRVIEHTYSQRLKKFIIIDVHRFLNHRIDTSLMNRIGLDMAKILAPYHPELIITAATSGIIPSQTTAHYLGDIPFLYARKEVPIMFHDNYYEANSFSITGGNNINLYLSKHCIKPGTRIAIIDDFLDLGYLAKNLISVIDQAKCNLVAAAFIIEKSQNKGRQKLNASGLTNNRIHSLLNISHLAPGKIKIAASKNWLTLKNQ